jgi:hypothetical protein
MVENRHIFCRRLPAIVSAQRNMIEGGPMLTMDEERQLRTDELNNSLDDIEARFANCSNRTEQERLKEDLQNLRDYLSTQLAAAVSETRPAMEHLAEARTTAGDQRSADELRSMADRLGEMARRRQEAA